MNYYTAYVGIYKVNNVRLGGKGTMSRSTSLTDSPDA
jgi:hypothetical protein